jgi:hypothetical protein
MIRKIFPIIIIGVLIIGWCSIVSGEEQEEKLIINIEGGSSFIVTVSNPNDEDISDIELNCNDVNNKINYFPKTYEYIGTIKAGESNETEFPAADFLGFLSESTFFPIEVVFTLSYGETTIERIVYCAISGFNILIAGTNYNDGGSYEGYTLYTPYMFERTYLINNDGEIVHKWDSGFTHSYGMGVYLTEDGKLLRTEFDSTDQFDYDPWKLKNEPGGMTGRVVRIEWDGNKDFKFPYYNEEYCLHHDIEPLPNGNILMIAWEIKSKSEAIAAGLENWDDNWGDFIYSDKIIEVDPDIWDPTKENYDEAIVW